MDPARRPPQPRTVLARLALQQEDLPLTIPPTTLRRRCRCPGAAAALAAAARLGLPLGLLLGLLREV